MLEHYSREGPSDLLLHGQLFAQQPRVCFAVYTTSLFSFWLPLEIALLYTGQGHISKRSGQASLQS